MSMPTKGEVDYYMTEGCGIFASALAEVAGRPEVYILSRVGGEAWSDDFPDEITHVLVKADDGLWGDACGRRALGVVAKDFHMYDEADYRILGPVRLDDFKTRYLGDSDSVPLYGNAADFDEASDFITKYRDFYVGSGPVEVADARKPRR